MKFDYPIQKLIPANFIVATFKSGRFLYYLEDEIFFTLETRMVNGMVSWNIGKTELWNNRSAEKELFDIMTRGDNLGVTLLMTIGIWTVWQQRQKEKAAGKKPDGKPVVLTKKIVEECFADKQEGANSFLIGGLNEEREKILRKGMEMLVGAEFY